MMRSLFLLFALLAVSTASAQERPEVLTLRAAQNIPIFNSPEAGIMEVIATVPMNDSFVVSQHIRSHRLGYWKVYYAGAPAFLPEGRLAAVTHAVADYDRMLDALKGGRERTREARDAEAARLSQLYAYRKEQRRRAVVEQQRVADSVQARKAFAADSIRLVQMHTDDSLRSVQEAIAQRHTEIADSIALVESTARLSASIERLRARFGSYGLMIAQWDWNYDSEYSSAAGFEVRIWNPMKKRIKYIYFSLIAYDPVGSRLSSFGKTVVTVKAIGPVEPAEFGSWEFENVFWSNVIAKMSISSIKVEYMDGSVKVISQPSKIDMSD